MSRFIPRPWSAPDRSGAKTFSNGTDALRKFVYSMTGLMYGVLLALLGWTATGAGHGTFFYFSLAVFPYGVGLILWPVIGFLLADTSSNLQRAMFLIVVFGRYALLAVYVVRYFSSELPHMEITWRYSHFDIIAPLALFLVGQIVIWALFLSAGSQKEKSGTSYYRA